MYVSKRAKNYIISLISFFFLVQLIVWFIYNNVTNWHPKIETNNSVNYPELRKAFGNWFDLFFLTDQVMIAFSLVGSFYFIFHNNNIYKSIFFCSISFMIFNIFALTHFRVESVGAEPYGSYRTLMSHLVSPVAAFGILFWIRKEIILNWKVMFISSTYLSLFYLSILIIYYSRTYYNSLGELEHLKVYDFFDFNRKIIIFDTTQMIWRVITNIFLLISSPIVSMIIFMIFKFVFNIKISKCLFRQNKF